MDTHRTAQFIASLMLANCEAYIVGRKTKVARNREQNRLLTLAMQRGVMADVARMVKEA